MTISKIGLVALASVATIGAGQAAATDHQHSAPQGAIAPLHIAAGERIANEYVIVLKDDVSVTSHGDTAVAAVADVATSSGGTVHKQLSALNMITATLDDAALQQVRQDPAVAYVEADTIVSTAARQDNATWGLDRVDQTSSALDGIYHYDNTGRGVHAYVVDTGIKASHNEFIGRAADGFSSVDDAPDSDESGHGTHVAGTLAGTTYGIAKEATIHSVKVFDASGRGPISDVVDGLNWVAENMQFPAVVNLSLSGQDMPALDDAASAIADAGGFVAAASGNKELDACEMSPGRADNVFGVSGTNRDDEQGEGFAFGACIDLMAPGVDVLSAGTDSNDHSREITGTSMATPHVSGAAALLLQNNPTMSPATVANVLKQNATREAIRGDLKGAPNLLLNTRPSGAPNDGGNTDLPKEYFKNEGYGLILNRTVTSPLVSETARAQHVSVVPNLYHSCLEQLTIDVITPDGVKHPLKEDEVTGTCTPIDGELPFSVPATGKLDGTWKLNVLDSHRGEHGQLSGWYLRFS